MSAAFTPGPWNTEGDGIVRVPGDGEFPVKIGTGWREDAWTGEDADAETLANARLIAAAPELYEVLAELEQYLDDDEAPLERVSRALAKARGDA